MEILGVDVGGSGIKAGLVDSTTGELTSDRIRIDTPQPASIEAVTDVIAELSSRLESESPRIGVAFPARIKNGIVTTATNIGKEFIGTQFDSVLSSALGKQVTVLNDADAAGLAEIRFGAGVDREGVVIMITVGTGLGTALFVDGILVPGTELGHLKLKKKLADSYASDSGRKDDDLSWEDWAKRFQRYLDRVEFLFAPDLIIIGGGISKASKKTEYFHYLSTKADLVTASLGNNAGIVGAACAVIDK